MSLYLNERPLGELLVDLGFVHDVLGSAGVLQGAQSLLHGQKRSIRAQTYDFINAETRRRRRERTDVPPGCWRKATRWR